MTIVLLSYIFLTAFLVKRLLRYLRFFQQEEYDTSRFCSWLFRSLAFDKRASIALLLVSGLVIITKASTVAAAAQIILFTLLFFTEVNPLESGKIKLNFTARAKRIFYLALVILGALLGSVWLLFGYTISWPQILALLLLIQAIPFSLLLANFLLRPFELYTKTKYKNEAIKILKQVNPYVIGITGSYGKTSVKAALGEVLNNVLAPTFYPPKSYNTEMGITKSIRESLQAEHKYAVIEMGAYNVGSIKKLCSLTPPHAGIVTVVGMAHLERYGSVEQVYKAKSELAQAIVPEGILVCNGDDGGARRMAKEYPKKTTLLYGFDNTKGHLDCHAELTSTSLAGAEFTIKWKGKAYSGRTKLLGRPALSNLLGVFTMSCALGADPNFVLASIGNIQPVDNRLAISKEGAVTFLRDAYNSNPAGFESALDVLKSIPAKRKILMTPGMIELGHLQYEENKKAGFKAGSCCDLALIVGETNKQALVEGLTESGFSKEAIILCNSREAAFQKLNELLEADDLILIENDLPDLYEVRESF